MSTQLPERVGRYEVVERLGTGGMGVVYLATDPLLRRTVAVKVLPSESEELRERFAREGRSAAALRHNNIVTIYDVGDDNGQPFIAMEFLDGESMAEMIRRRAPLTVPRRLQLIVELCTGLGYAHRNGIVHRDIKPANLMITTEGGLKVLDFGLARVISEPTLGALTGVATLLGTPHYLAPEQIAGTTGDKTSDIFAVGLVLYEFLSYRKAFPGDSGPAILFDIVEKEPTSIRELVPDIDDELETIVAKAIEKDRGRRYADLELLAEALEHVRVRLARSPDDSALPRKHRRKPRLGGIAQSADAASADPGDQRLDAIAQKRALKIAEHLAAAAAELQAGQCESVIEHCEHALLLDADDEQALELLRQAHRGIEDAQVQGWIDEAKVQLSRDALTEAEQLIEQSLRIRADRPDLLSLQSELKERHRERERRAEQQRSAQAAMERANRNMEHGALEAVVRSASEALAYDPEHAEARELKARAIALIEERQRQPERVAVQPEPQHPDKESDRQRDEGAQAEPRATDDRPEPVRTAASQIVRAFGSTLTQPAFRGAASLAGLRPMHRLLMAAAVLVVVVSVWLAWPRSAATTPAPLAPEALVTAPPVSADRLAAEQNAERYRRLLQQAEERLAATDAVGASAAIQEAEKILGGDPRLDELKKRVDSVRADAARAQQQQADIDVALGQAAKLTSDTEAIATLQRELARYPGTAAITEAIAARTQARDSKIADRLRRAQSAPDEQAVTLLQEALAFNPARLDVRRELDRRRGSMTAAAKARNPRAPGSREAVEEEVRRTLYAYQSAYASRSVEEFLKVAPFRTRAQIEAEFSRFRSIQLNIEGVAIDLDESGTRASIKCTISTVFVPFGPNAKAMMDKRAWQFQLTYAGGAWQITRADSR